MAKKDARIHIRASSELAERLSQASELADVPASQLIREAVDEKLDKLSKRFPALRREESAPARV
jgi:predicted DNA-binding protein